MLNSQNLINKICACISGGGLTALQSCQLNGALNVLCSPVCSVATFSNLPDATTYVGRMIYVQAENRYYYSFDGLWLNDFQSTPLNYKDTMWSWGCNNVGQLGDNTTTNKSSPISVVSSFTDWYQVSAANHNLGLRSSGTAWAWGCNGEGRLGDNTTTNQSSPVSVVGGFTDWCKVNTGGAHSMAVRTNGGLWGWGANGPFYSRIGDNTTTSRSSPVSVVGGFTDWFDVSGGSIHTLAVRTNGTAWAWGCNGSGRLGNNAVLGRNSPVSVVGGFSDWCNISAGCAHSLGNKQDGTAWGWGSNANGILGDNTTTARSSPVSVVGSFTDWCDISAGAYHSVAVRTIGTIWSWGLNGQGRLGDNTTTTRSSPVSVVGGFTDWCQISAGTSHTMALRTNGTAWAWGCNACGILGDCTVTSRSSPVSVVGGCSDWFQVSAGIQHSLAVRQIIKGF